MKNKQFIYALLRKIAVNEQISKKAQMYDEVKKSLEQKGFKENAPTYSGKIAIPAALPGVSVTVPDNPIINGKYNVFFQIRSGYSPTKAGVNTIIVEAEAGGKASAENTATFGNKDWINKQLGIIQAELSKRFGNVTLGKLGLGSFSGGFDAVGKIIDDPEMKDKIDSLVILDGIHHGKRGKPDPVGMKKWLDFAKKAKEDPNKKFVFLYSAVDPSRYASTSDSAYYLTDNLGVPREKAPPDKTYAGVNPATIANAGGFTAIQLYPRLSEEPGYGYKHYPDNRPGSMGHQHIQTAKAMPEILGEYLSDWNKG